MPALRVSISDRSLEATMGKDIVRLCFSSLVLAGGLFCAAFVPEVFGWGIALVIVGLTFFIVSFILTFSEDKK